jgi:hypothetical protein
MTTATATKRRRSNPFSVNQYTQLDPRQKVCWDYFIDPRSDTFSNAKQSALKAGYTETTSNQITTELWFTERVRRFNMVSKAERNIDEVLDLPIKDPLTGKIDSVAIANRTRVDMFVLERLGKDEGYSTKQELVHSNNIKLTEGNPLLDDLFGDGNDI